MEEKFDEGKWKRQSELQTEYVHLTEENQKKFQKFVEENFPRDVEFGGFLRFKLAFFQYDDAEACAEMCKAAGYDVTVVEPPRNAPIKKSQKCFEVRLNNPMGMTMREYIDSKINEI